MRPLAVTGSIGIVLTWSWRGWSTRGCRHRHSCQILLMGGGDPLFLRAKEAQTSALEAFAETMTRVPGGQRVVHGQRLMQAASDIFLGWQQVDGIDGVQPYLYVRQLRCWAAFRPIEHMVPAGMPAYARLCGWTLARANDRAGDRSEIAAYVGRKNTFDQGIADLAVAYVDQNEKDHAALATAISTGRLLAETGL